jgi:hypothetical protein
LRGRSDDDAVPTVVVVAHYDALAAAPGKQGDKIGRVFTEWESVDFGQFLADK